MMNLAVTDQPGQAGPLGLFVILVLAVATAFLIRSMRQHLRRIPPTFQPPPERGTGEPPDHSDS